MAPNNPPKNRSPSVPASPPSAVLAVLNLSIKAPMAVLKKLV